MLFYASTHVLDEAERSLHDALCVLVQTVQDSRVIWGGGWPEFLMARRVEELGRKTAGKKSLAIDAFATALRAIPTTIADNAGLDSAELVSELRAAHSEDGCRSGIDVISGEVLLRSHAVEEVQTTHGIFTSFCWCILLTIFFPSRLEIWRSLASMSPSR